MLLLTKHLKTAGTLGSLWFVGYPKLAIN